MSQDPNSFDKDIADAQSGANPADHNQGTGGDSTQSNTTPDGAQSVDYQKKFAESSKEALRLFEENKKKDEEIARLAAIATQHEKVENNIDSLYPGFEQLDPEAQKNLVSYTNLIVKRAEENLNKNPAIAHAVTVYNESKFDRAFGDILTQYPDLKTSKDEFKKKYFNPQNTPDNIKDILNDLAKVHLFDKAVDIGAKGEKEKIDRIDLNRSTGGDKTPKASRTIEDWNRMAQDNPAKFAKLSKEFSEDINSGKI